MNCPKCGHELSLNNTFCENCGYSAEGSNPNPAEPVVKKNNFFGGVLGAVIGAVLGMAVIILFSRIGMVSALGGLALAFCTTKGYELLGGTLDTKGKILCLLLIIASPYIADRIDWALIVVRDLQWSFSEAFSYIPQMVESGMIESSTYYSNLGQLYLFSLLGAIAIIVGLFQKKKAAA